jgi:hypothetical protein
MPNAISLTLRTAAKAESAEEVPIVLVTITHEDLEEPIRLSSDPTKRLSLDPLRYGTVSGGQEYDFVLMSAILPDDKDDAPAAASLAFENVFADMASVVRAVSTPAAVDFKLVLASAPDDVEEQYTGLQATKGSYDANRVTLEVSGDLLMNIDWPYSCMTQRRFPGLFR